MCSGTVVGWGCEVWVAEYCRRCGRCWGAWEGAVATVSCNHSVWEVGMGCVGCDSEGEE